jgi:cytochrome c biogenesis protein CcdA
MGQDNTQEIEEGLKRSEEELKRIEEGRKRREEERKRAQGDRKWSTALLIGSFTVGLNVLFLILGIVVDSIPVALAISCVGVITFAGVLAFCNYLSADKDIAKKEIRKALAASIVLVYLSLLPLVLFGTDSSGGEDIVIDSAAAESLMKHFTWVVGIVVTFYFGSRIVDKFKQNGGG